jgi:hypothetical protein
MELLIDDVRDLGCDLIARNYGAGVKVLLNMPIDFLYLDHDLGPGKTGYDVLNFIFRPDIRIFPKVIFLVTMNPVGRDNMKRALEANGYIAKGNQKFVRE